MPVNLSIKNVPDDLAEQLRARAARNHRSLQGELVALLEHALGDAVSSGLGEQMNPYGAEERLTASEVLKRTQKSVIRTEGESVVDMIRRTRDGAYAPMPKGTLTVDEVVERVRKLGLPRVDEAARLVREDRNSR